MMTVEKAVDLTTVCLYIMLLMIFREPYKSENCSLRFFLTLSFSMTVG